MPDGKNFSKVYYDDGERIPFREFVRNIMIDGTEQGYFTNYPEKLIMVAHYNVADLTAFSDFHKIKDRFETVRASFSTMKDLPINVQIKSNYHTFKIILRDTINLAPQGMHKLEDLGKIMGIEKIDLEAKGYSVTNMEKLMIENKSLFETYALKNVEITAKYMERIMKYANESSKKNSVPPSLASISVSIFSSFLEKIGVDRLKLMGRYKIESKSGGKYYIPPREVLIPVLSDNQALANECFYGGRSESYFYGPCNVDNWLDIDLIGAYTTTMATIGIPLYDGIKRSIDPDDYSLGVLGYARLKSFRFPANTVFPNIPHRYDAGIQFVLEGKDTYATANDIWLARKMGAEIEIDDGIIIPCDMSRKPFLEFVRLVTENRKKAQAENNKFDNQFWKEIGNSLYGKMAQGRPLGNKFDSRSEKMEECKITNVFLAGYITSLTRVCIGEQMSYIYSQGYQILSVTIDGYITNFPKDRLNELLNLESSKLYSQARLDISGNGEIIEIKKKAKQILSIKKRGQIELDSKLNLDNSWQLAFSDAPDDDSGEDLILSKAGIRPPRHLKSDVEKRDWFIKEHLQRGYKSKIERCKLPTATYMKNHCKEDFHEIVQDFVFNTDYDMSRKPLNIEMGKLNDKEHIKFKTMPYRDIQEFLNYKDKWKHFTGRYETTMMNHQAVKLFLKAMKQNQERIDYHSYDCHFDFKKFKLQILRAYKNEELGFKKKLSDIDFAKYLTDTGYETTIHDLQNAKNLKPMYNKIFATKEINIFLEVIKYFEPSINLGNIVDKED